MRKIIYFPWYPFFFALYPVLSLLAHNLTQVSESAGIRSVLAALLGTSLVFLLMSLVQRSWVRGAFIAAIWTLLFFSYGQVYDLVSSKWKIATLSAWMLGIWLLLLVGSLILGSLRKIHIEGASLILNVVSAGLVVYCLALFLMWSLRKTPAAAVNIPGPDPALSVPAGKQLPDIYYIMPEDYGRADLLQQYDQIDDSTFMQFLKDAGFYVAQCSQSNYVTSELSIGSSLNMDYLQNLDPKFTAANLDQSLIWNAIRYNAVSADLKKAGYTTVAFATGYDWSELNNADIYISPTLLWSEMTGFETLLLRTTPLRHLEDLGLLNLDQLDGERFRERTLMDFNSVGTLSQMPGPKFVFMQIIAPHPPFVFASNGADTNAATFMNAEKQYTTEKYVQGFRNEVPYLNQMLEMTINTLIKKSTRPVVIILQTDTGPWLTSGADQFKILNAYYMPGHTNQLYAGISPVNTFRTVLDAYLNDNLPLLQDTSYFSPIPHIYDFSVVPNPCASN